MLPLFFYLPRIRTRKPASKIYIYDSALISNVYKYKYKKLGSAAEHSICFDVNVASPPSLELYVCRVGIEIPRKLQQSSQGEAQKNCGGVVALHVHRQQHQIFIRNIRASSSSRRTNENHLKELAKGGATASLYKMRRNDIATNFLVIFMNIRIILMNN